MKPILPRAHAIIDYLLVMFLAIVPTFWGFVGYPANMCYVLAVIFLVMSLLTDYNGGVVRIIGFAVHGLFELIIAIAVMIIAWRNLSDYQPAEHFFILFGIGLLMFWVLSDYN
jgi:hypothetical protein